MEDALKLPLLDKVLLGGLKFGANILVEFEADSPWYETSLVVARDAVRQAIKTEYHTFQHLPSEVRESLKRIGLDVQAAERNGTLRIIDSYTATTGLPVPEAGSETWEPFQSKSTSLSEWSRDCVDQMNRGFDESEKNWLHIDENTSVLLQYNTEKEFVDFWRISFTPYARARGLTMIHALVSGAADESFYKKFEAGCDGIFDFKSEEKSGGIQRVMRVRMMRNRPFDSKWYRIDVSGDGEVDLRPAAEEPTRRLAAIMFTDTVGFTDLGQRDEALMLRLIDEQRTLVRPIISGHRGREVKTTGDGFLVEFASSQDAVRCALEMQSALNGANAKRPQAEQMLVRVGIHLGDVTHEGADVAGDAVNVASRIEPLAAPGGICVTRQVYDSVVKKVECEFESIGTPSMKNVSAQVEVYQVVGFGRRASKQPPAASAPQKERIAVLPFANISPDRSDEFLSDGMTEETIAAISRIAGLRVIARTSVMRYKESGKPISEVGRELGVGNVLEGSVRRSGDKLRVTVQLVDASTEESRWSEEYDRPIKDVFEIQSDIANRVAEVLRARALGGTLSVQKPTVSTEAYIDYLRGRQAWNKRTEEGLRQAIGLFEKALEQDKDYAKAYSGLADSYASLALLELLPPIEAYPKAKEAIGKALALDPQLVEAHSSLGLIRFQFDWDWRGAEEEFREAVRINPSYAPAHHFFADYLKAMGRFDEALAEIGKAQELDPLNLAINTGVGHVLYLSRQYDRAIEQYRRAVELDPSFMLTHIWFGRPYLEKGMYEEAISELETAVRLSGEGTLALAMLGHGLASAGRKEEALKVLGKLQERSKVRYVPSYWIAVIYNGLHERDQVISWLTKAFEERSSWLVWVKVEPRFDWLRQAAEFETLLGAMKFP